MKFLVLFIGLIFAMSALAQGLGTGKIYTPEDELPGGGPFIAPRSPQEVYQANLQKFKRTLRWNGIRCIPDSKGEPLPIFMQLLLVQKQDCGAPLNPTVACLMKDLDGDKLFELMDNDQFLKKYTDEDIATRSLLIELNSHVNVHR